MAKRNLPSRALIISTFLDFQLQFYSILEMYWSLHIPEHFEQATLSVSSGKLDRVSENDKSGRFVWAIHIMLHSGSAGAAPREGPSAALDPVAFTKWTS